MALVRPNKARVLSSIGLAGWIGLALPAAANQGLIARDGTLGSGALAVGTGLDPLGQPADYLITPDLGEQHGANLFHSFARFGIGAGETATFTGPDPIAGPQSVANVIGRVTGGSSSELNGTLRSTIPGADLWLINPSGLVFGHSGRLDVEGSFHASTADSLAFDDAGVVRFYADPMRPSVLAIAEPRAFGFLDRAPSGAASLVAEGTTLRVPAGETLSLIARDGLALGFARIAAENGRVNLAAVEGAGDVVLGERGSVEPLGATNTSLGVVTLATGSAVDTSGAAPGAIFIRGGEVVVETSQVLAANHGASVGGLIDVDARDRLDVDGGLLSVSTDSAGAAGTIRLRGGEQLFRNGLGLVDVDPGTGLPLTTLPRAAEAGASAETTAGGAAGTIQIDADSLTISNGAAISAQTVGLGGVEASGQGGVVRIHSDGDVLVRDRGYVTVESWDSRGDAGTIEVRAAGTLRVDGDWLTTLSASSLAPISRLDISPEINDGRAGSIEIEADAVELENGGFIASQCLGCIPGAGRVQIQANRMRAVEHGTIAEDGLRRHGVGSSVRVDTAGEGDAGTIVVDLSGSLELLNGATLAAATVGPGNGGSITVHADSVLIDQPATERGGGLIVLSAGAGDVGTIEVHARSLVLGPNWNGGEPAIYAQNSGSGRGGRVLIDVDSLVVGGAIYVSTDSSGSGGRLEVHARSVVVEGGWMSSSALASGSGGVIEIRADSLIVRDGDIFSGTSSSGYGGRIDVNARSILVQQGGSMQSTTFGTGRGGDIHLVADSITLRDAEPFDAEVPDPPLTGLFAFTIFGGGDAGSITAEARDITVTDGAAIASSTIAIPGEPSAGKAGDVLLRGERIRVLNGALVDSSAIVASWLEPTPEGDETGNAGSVAIIANEAIEIAGHHADAPDQLARVHSASVTKAQAGSVKLSAPEIRIHSGGRVATDAPGADGGEIAVVARDLLHLVGGEITAGVTDGSGGDISIDPTFVILDRGSSITARASGGSGGHIQIETQALFVSADSIIDASSKLGIDGTVEIRSPDVDLSGALTALPASFVDAASLLRERCAARRTGERAGSFSVHTVGGVAPEPDGALPAHLGAAGERVSAARRDGSLADVGPLIELGSAHLETACQ